MCLFNEYLGANSACWKHNALLDMLIVKLQQSVAAYSNLSPFSLQFSQRVPTQEAATLWYLTRFVTKFPKALG